MTACFPQVSRTLLGILADFNDAIFWLIYLRSPISNSSNSLSKPLGIVPRALITIGITVTFIFHYFFSYQARSNYLSFFLFSLTTRTTKSTIRQVVLHFFVVVVVVVYYLVKSYVICLYLKISEICASHSLVWILVCT